MISPSLHPDAVSAVCERRRRWSFGLTPRTIGLLLLGFVWLVPGFWDWRLALAMPAWDALVLLAALLDGLRLPAPAELTAGRSWSNAPALDSEHDAETPTAIWTELASIATAAGVWRSPPVDPMPSSAE